MPLVAFFKRSRETPWNREIFFCILSLKESFPRSFTTWAWRWWLGTTLFMETFMVATFSTPCLMTMWQCWMLELQHLWTKGPLLHLATQQKLDVFLRFSCLELSLNHIRPWQARSSRCFLARSLFGSNWYGGRVSAAIQRSRIGFMSAVWRGIQSARQSGWHLEWLQGTKRDIF